MSVASLLAAILYQGHPDWNHKLWNIVTTEIYISFVLKLGAMANIHIMDQDLSLLRYFLIITIVKLQYDDQ